MRFAVIFALVLAAGPAAAGQCIYSSQSGQTVDWSGGDSVTFDPLYTDKVTCRLVRDGQNPNYFTADCGSYTDTLVLGASSPDASNADILVWGNVFYWLKCEKDHA